MSDDGCALLALPAELLWHVFAMGAGDAVWVVWRAARVCRRLRVVALGYAASCLAAGMRSLPPGAVAAGVAFRAACVWRAGLVRRVLALALAHDAKRFVTTCGAHGLALVRLSVRSAQLVAVVLLRAAAFERVDGACGDGCAFPALEAFVGQVDGLASDPDVVRMTRACGSGGGTSLRGGALRLCVTSGHSHDHGHGHSDDHGGGMYVCGDQGGGWTQRVSLHAEPSAMKITFLRTAACVRVSPRQLVLAVRCALRDDRRDVTDGHAIGHPDGPAAGPTTSRERAPADAAVWLSLAADGALHVHAARHVRCAYVATAEQGRVPLVRHHGLRYRCRAQCVARRLVRALLRWGDLAGGAEAVFGVFRWNTNTAPYHLLGVRFALDGDAGVAYTFHPPPPTP